MKLKNITLPKIIKYLISKKKKYLFIPNDKFIKNFINKKVKYLHIMPNDKFIKDFIKFINQEFSPQEHLFLIDGGYTENEIPILNLNNVINLHNKKVRKKMILKLLKLPQKIILHSLFLDRMIGLLDENHDILYKCTWLIWGRDLYDVVLTPKIADSQLEKAKKRIIAKMRMMITNTKEEYDFSKKVYPHNAIWFKSFFYPNNSYQEFKVNFVKKQKDFTILIGQSADHYNNHLAIFQKIKKYQKIGKIICPLAYPASTQSYAEAVTKEGQKIFGKKFHPILELMNRADYLKMQFNEVDIAIFDYPYQKALGNTITLLSMGKKVYLSEQSFIKQDLEKKKIKIFSIENIEKEDIFHIDEKIMKNNIALVKEYFSKQKLIEHWKNLFDYNINFKK